MRVTDLSGKILNRWTWSRFRPGRAELNSSFRTGKKARSAWQKAAVADRQAETLSWLQAAVRNARENVPYYTALLKEFPPEFPVSFADFSRLPVLEKEIIRSRKDELISRQFPLSSLTRQATGGSTGEPVVVYLSQSDWGWILSGQQFHQEILGCPHGSRIGTLYGGDVEVSSRISLKESVWQWLTNYSIHGCFRMDDAYLHGVHREFSRFKPEMIVTYSSAMYLLALLLEREGIRPDYPGRLILTGGEKLEDIQREVLERVFRVPVLERYGSREVGLMAYQLPGGNRDFHVDNCYCLLEPEGKPDQNGLAPILVTTLQNRAMPLLRYRIGDLGKFPATWSVKTPVDRLEEIVGRTVDYIFLPGNRCIHSIEFPHLFKDYDVRQYQIVQSEDMNVLVRIVSGAAYDEDQRQRLQKIILENLSGVAVNFEYVESLERTSGHAKLRPVISRYQSNKTL